jgi:site-specific recombinase XerD
MPQHGNGDIVKMIYVSHRDIKRHLDGRLLKEREEYLWHLLENGTGKPQVRLVASRILDLVQLLRMTRLCKITKLQVEETSIKWGTQSKWKTSRKGRHEFQNTAIAWLQFHGCLKAPALTANSLWALHEQFIRHISETLGQDSIHTNRFKVASFLRWMEARNLGISSLSVAVIDRYLFYKQKSGIKLRSVAAYAQCLRAFCRYLEARKLLQGIADGIEIPKISKQQREPVGPKWSDVERLRKVSSVEDADEYRVIAIIALAAIYGLRNVEIRKLTLDSFNWTAETFTVVRAKSRRVQEFPLQLEVGEAIIRYLLHGRPRCACRNIFVSHRAPHLPLTGPTVSTLVNARMKSHGLTVERYGTHSLRHSCATQLLKKGCSLREIADFLGHRDLRSVSIYAKFDGRGLRRVAAFSLGGLK